MQKLIEKLIERIESQNELILQLQSNLKETTLKHISLEAAFYILIASLTESSPKIGEKLQANAEQALSDFLKSETKFPFLEKQLQILCGKDAGKQPYLKLLKSQKLS